MIISSRRPPPTSTTISFSSFITWTDSSSTTIHNRRGRCNNLSNLQGHWWATKTASSPISTVLLRPVTVVLLVVSDLSPAASGDDATSTTISTTAGTETTFANPGRSNFVRLRCYEYIPHQCKWQHRFASSATVSASSSSTPDENRGSYQQLPHHDRSIAHEGPTCQCNLRQILLVVHRISSPAAATGT